MEPAVKLLKIHHRKEDTPVLEKGASGSLPSRPGYPRKSVARAGVLSRLLVVLALTLAVATSGNCKYINPFNKPEVNFKKVEFKKVDFQGIRLLALLEVDNPNPLGLKIKKLFYDFYLEGESLAQGYQETEQNIKPNRRTILKIPVNVNFKSLGGRVKDVFTRDKLKYELRGYLKIDSPVGELTFNFEDFDFHKGKIKIPDLPEVSLEDFTIADFGLREINAELGLSIRNTNDFAFNIRKFVYALSVNDYTISQGRYEQGTEVPLRGNESLSFKIPVNLKVLNLHKSILLMLRSNRMRYKLRMNLYIDSLDGPIKFPLVRQGEVDISLD